MGEDKSGGHVSVGDVGGRGVHCRGRDGGGQQRNSTDISIFRALSFPIYFLYPATLPVLIRFFLALILIRTNAITHPHSSSPNPSILLRPLQIQGHTIRLNPHQKPAYVTGTLSSPTPIRTRPNSHSPLRQITTIGTRKTGLLTYLTSRFQNLASLQRKKNRRNLA